MGDQVGAAGDAAATGDAAGGVHDPRGAVPDVSDLRAARTAKLAAAREGLSKMHAAAAAAASTDADTQEHVESAAGAKAGAAPSTTADDAAKAKLAAKGESKVEEDTTKGIEAIERREKRAQEKIATERASWKQERDLEVAELKKLRDDLTGKATSLDELKKLAKSRPLDALKALGIESEDDLEVVARQTYAVSKSGKADPKNKAYADQIAEKHGVASEISELKKQLTELTEKLTTRDQHAEAKQQAERWIDDGVKAIPTTPTHIGRAYAANPTKARGELLATGQTMLREAIEENGGRYDASLEPKHADVIARYESNKRQALKDDGFTDDQIAAMLKPAAAAAAAKQAVGGKTLDVGTARATTSAAPQSRKEKVAIASVGLKKLWAEP